MMLLKLHEASGYSHTELTGMDVYDFMLLYNELVHEARKKKKE